MGFRQIEKFENIRILDHVNGAQWIVRLACFAKHPLLVMTLQQPFVKKTVDLALELPDAPPLPRSFSLVEIACISLFNTHEKAVMRPAKGRIKQWRRM